MTITTSDLNEATTIKVYLNEGANYFEPFGEKSALIKVAEFDLILSSIRLIDGQPVDVLNRVYEQLNVGGDIVPAEPWTEVYRAERNRSLSVGDVVVIGETAWAVARFGFESITTDALTGALKES